jgi:hypothetical protein
MPRHSGVTSLRDRRAVVSGQLRPAARIVQTFAEALMSADLDAVPGTGLRAGQLGSGRIPEGPPALVAA